MAQNALNEWNNKSFLSEQSAPTELFTRRASVLMVTSLPLDPTSSLFVLSCGLNNYDVITQASARLSARRKRLFTRGVKHVIMMRPLIRKESTILSAQRHWLLFRKFSWVAACCEIYILCAWWYQKWELLKGLVCRIKGGVQGQKKKYL